MYIVIYNLVIASVPVVASRLINFNLNLYSIVLPTMMMLLHLDSFTQGFPALEIFGPCQANLKRLRSAESF